MRLFVRLALLGLVGLAVFGSWLSQSPSAPVMEAVEVTDGLCSESGTSLVIDFGTGSNKPMIVKCVSDYSGNSWDLINVAGITSEGTAKYPVGFVCRINDYPNQDMEKCQDTPGANTGSWAFYIAESNLWKYSSFGASSHKSKCGQTEGWRYLLPGEEISQTPRIKPLKISCEK